MKNLINHKRFKEVLVIYILFNLGILLTLYGSVLYSPSMIPDTESITPEGARMQIINLTKGALIAQNFKLSQYNIGFDMINVGGICLIFGLLSYNYLEAMGSNQKSNLTKLKIYKLREKGSLQGNLIEWMALVIFSFAFFTFLHNIFVHIIVLSFIIGIIGFTIRKFHLVDIWAKYTHN